MTFINNKFDYDFDIDWDYVSVNLLLWPITSTEPIKSVENTV